ncbi:hypothetical protein GC173_01475 [bacterium]|nr:hypothetical protein [bacterium]
MSDYTLQINLSPGDLAYAERTIPALVRAHPSAATVLLVVDLCRPERTAAIDPDKRFPVADFRKRCDATRELVERLRSLVPIDDVYTIEPGDPLIARLNRRFLGIDIRRTHDFMGCALTAYFAAFELPTTRFVLHYDADMILHQEHGFDWAAAAIPRMVTQPTTLAAVPRLTPPFHAPGSSQDQPERNSGVMQARVQGGWLDDWFSTRCLLVDREMLARHLPLPCGFQRLAVYTARWITGRGWPPSPELLLHQNAGAGGARRFILDDPRAWLLHPNRKDAIFLELLDGIMAAASRGAFPAEQGGWQDLRLDAWGEFLRNDSQA